ncbi:MAG TPA: hypothetical protein HA277_05135 [Methanosphaera sp.]|nr:hypothetical protein [Methanosphaera sp.]HII08846.1 hypothetical protein [Methanosphaera sp.]HIJ15770.1 hypothetical protein [Methanosphaera sp.]
MLFKINSNLVISTSRKPSQITRRFAQFLKHYFNGIYINRGKSSFSKVVNQAKQYDDALLIIITETKGNPSSLNVYNLEKDSEKPVSSLYLTVSLPQENNKVNTNDEIIIINKSSEFEEFLSECEVIKSDEKIKENCIVVQDDEKVICASFFDKKGEDTKFKIYIKGFKTGE